MIEVRKQWNLVSWNTASSQESPSHSLNSAVLGTTTAIVDWSLAFALSPSWIGSEMSSDGTFLQRLFGTLIPILNGAWKTHLFFRATTYGSLMALATWWPPSLLGECLFNQLIIIQVHFLDPTIVLVIIVGIFWNARVISCPIVGRAASICSPSPRPLTV